MSAQSAYQSAPVAPQWVRGGDGYLYLYHGAALSWARQESTGRMFQRVSGGWIEWKRR